MPSFLVSLAKLLRREPGKTLKHSRIGRMIAETIAFRDLGNAKVGVEQISRGCLDTVAVDKLLNAHAESVAEAAVQLAG